MRGAAQLRVAMRAGALPVAAYAPTRSGLGLGLHRVRARARVTRNRARTQTRTREPEPSVGFQLGAIGHLPNDRGIHFNDNGRLLLARD